MSHQFLAHCNKKPVQPQGLHRLLDSIFRGIRGETELFLVLGSSFFGGWLFGRWFVAGSLGGTG